MGIKSIVLAASAFALSTSVHAAVIEFHFTGQYTLLDPVGGYMDQQAIDSTLTYDDSTGAGFSAGMTIANFDTFGATASVYDITLQRQLGSNLIIGNMLIDWNTNTQLPISMVWDATGLFNAIDYGLQAGDVISGTHLKRDGVSIYDVQSATPASDGVAYNRYDPYSDLYESGVLNQGPAPLAVTTLNTSTLCQPGVYGDCIGDALSGGSPFTDDGISGSPMVAGPFVGINVNFDIGSGNSLTVLSVSSVPIPAAAWLFGSGLIGLIGMARRKHSD